jgi:hypothetical protein
MEMLMPNGKNLRKITELPMAQLPTIRGDNRGVATPKVSGVLRSMKTIIPTTNMKIMMTTPPQQMMMPKPLFTRLPIKRLTSSLLTTSSKTIVPSTSSFLIKLPDKTRSTLVTKKRHRLGKYAAKTAVTIKKIRGKSILGISEKDISKLDGTTPLPTAVPTTVESKGALAETEQNTIKQPSSTPMTLTYPSLTTTSTMGMLLSQQQQQQSVFPNMPIMMTGDDPLQMTLSNCLKMDRWDR